ncbi:MAG: site-specific integrase [Planctomycetaceae bacterium]
MPRLTHKQPSYRKHKASGRAVVSIAGKDVYLNGKYGSKESRDHYDRVIAEWLGAGRPSGPQPQAIEISVAEVLGKWWQHAKAVYSKDGKPTRTASNFKPVMAMLLRLYGSTPAVNFGPKSAKGILAEMVNAGWSRTYANDNLQRIRQIFRYAASEELIPETTYRALLTVDGLRKGQSGAKERPPVCPIDDAIVNATLPHLPEIIRAMVVLQRVTAARPSEIFAMRPIDVDCSSEEWIYRPTEHKTARHGKSRVIVIGPKGQEVLRPFLERAPESFCFMPAESKRIQRERRTALRTTPSNTGNRAGQKRKRWPKARPGEKFNKDAYRRAITRGCEVAFNMPVELRRAPKDETPEAKADRQAKASEWRAKHCWNPYRLRHTAATEVREHFGLEGAAAALGHANMRTSEIYAQKSLTRAKEVAKKLG